MTSYGKHPSLRAASDPTDLVWHWFILNGPHGETFKWQKDVPNAPRDLEVLEKFIEENSRANANFRIRAREIALEALEMDDPVLIRKAIQVLTVVGTDEEMLSVARFLDHAVPTVSKDARTALFERRIRNYR